MSICFLNDKYLEIQEAKISPLDRGFLFGDAIYEVIIALNKKPFELDAHIERLKKNISKLKYSIDDQINFREIVSEIISKNKTHFFIEIHDEFLRKQGLDSKDIFSYFDPKKYKHKILFIKDGKPLERNPFESEMRMLKEKGLTEGYLKPGNIVRKTRVIYIHFIPRLN